MESDISYLLFGPVMLKVLGRVIMCLKKGTRVHPYWGEVYGECRDRLHWSLTLHHFKLYVWIQTWVLV